MRAVAGALLLATILILSCHHKARADDCVFGAYGCGHHENHEQYGGWKREPDAEGNRMSCCHDGDCRPTRAMKGDPDHPGEDDDSWYAWDGFKWRKVPAEAMLPTDLLKDGRNHICAPRSGDGVYCFSPAQPKG